MLARNNNSKFAMLKKTWQSFLALLTCRWKLTLWQNIRQLACFVFNVDENVVSALNIDSVHWLKVRSKSVTKHNGSLIPVGIIQCMTWINEILTYMLQWYKPNNEWMPKSLANVDFIVELSDMLLE